jgi:hypothetical protein
MSDWDDLKHELIDAGLDTLAKMIPEQLAHAVLAIDGDHPARELLLSPRSRPLPAFARLTDHALEHIARWLEMPGGAAERGWLTSKLDNLSDSAQNASGAMAELRALGTMLSTADGPSGGLGVTPFHSKARAPDFRVGRAVEAYVEVCCVRINEDERKRQQEFDVHEEMLRERAKDAAEAHQRSASPKGGSSAFATAEWRDTSKRVHRHSVEATAFTRPDGSVVTFALSTRLVSPAGPLKAQGAVHTVASRIAGRKTGGQVPDGRPGILWMDLVDPSWCVRVKDARPAEVFWKGMALANTPGVWHAVSASRGRVATG